MYLEFLLQMVMAQSFPAWAEEGIISRATGVVWIILILVQNDREEKNKTKQKNIADGPCPCDARASPKISVP